jgi:hypothetical protein
VCARHNLVKEPAGWTATVQPAGPDEAHTVRFRTSTGHEYHSLAPPLMSRPGGDPPEQSSRAPADGSQLGPAPSPSPGSCETRPTELTPSGQAPPVSSASRPDGDVATPHDLAAQDHLAASGGIAAFRARWPAAHTVTPSRPGRRELPVVHLTWAALLDAC